MDPNDSGKLERLRRHLYSRKNSGSFEDKRSGLGQSEETTANQEWKTEEPAAPQAGAESTAPGSPAAPASAASPESFLRVLRDRGVEKKGRSFFSLLFIAALIFFILSVGVAAYIFYGGWNSISPNNVDISILGPVSVTGGTVLPLNIIVKNSNALDLEGVTITAHFPDSTRSPQNLAVPLTTDTEALGEIKAGQSAQRTVNAVFFGPKGDVQNVTVSVDYKIKASTAPYHKEKQFQIGIASSPVIMTIGYPSEVNSGTDVQFDLDVTSNTNDNLDNVIVRAEYPSGFTFTSSDPAPYADTNVWQLGTLKPLEKRHITIHGTMQAEDNEQRTFTFVTGTAAPSDPRQIGVGLTTEDETVTVKKPQIALSLLFSGSNQNLTIPAAGSAQATIEWKNNLPVNLVNAKVVATLSGDILNKASVEPGNGGYYKSLDNTVTWDANSLPSLGEITPGGGASVSLSLAALAVTSELLSSTTNPEISLNVVVTGSRLDAGGVPQQVTSSITKQAKIATDLGLTQRLVYSVGPFTNTGPIPPKADTETTYTIIWDITDTFNDVSNAKIVATLPPYVKWEGAVSPTAEKVSFNSATNQVTWSAGNIQRGTGFLTSPREVAFQIGVTPSVTQVDSVIPVIGQTTLTGTDNFTGEAVSTTRQGLTSALSADPNFDARSGHVVK